MIKRLTRGKEISVGVINQPGVLANVTSFLVNHSINVGAIAGSAAAVGAHAALMFITDDNAEAIKALTEHGYTVKENDVIIVEIENSPGSLKNISEVLAQNGINIAYIYGTTCMGGCPAKLILSTSDNDEAFAILSS